MEASTPAQHYDEPIRERLKACTTAIEVPQLRQSVAHLLGRGKLYRPRLVLATCQAATGTAADAHVGVACSTEILHTATLVHDDLPCLDDAQLRRGVKTVHLAYDEATAILAGDALLNLAFTTALTEGRHLAPTQSLGVLSVLTVATGSIMEGQVLDMLGEEHSLSLDELVELHSRKTGALIGACCAIGAILAGCQQSVIDRLQEIGVGIGLGFQIRDDLLSVQSTERATGKTLSTDTDRDKATFPRMMGIDAAGEYAQQVLHRTQLAIDELQLVDPEPLLTLARQAIDRGS